jgi:hypothetical protein
MSDLEPKPEFTCWLCGNLGAIRKAYSSGGKGVFIAFQFDPAKGIRLDRDEHTCPACGGVHNPHRTEFPIRLGGGAT